MGGVGKGWLADRALALLAAWPGAVIDADGDLAIMCPAGQVLGSWGRRPACAGSSIGRLAAWRALGGLPTRWGVAKSGTLSTAGMWAAPPATTLSTRGRVGRR